MISRDDNILVLYASKTAMFPYIYVICGKRIYFSWTKINKKLSVEFLNFSYRLKEPESWLTKLSELGDEINCREIKYNINVVGGFKYISNEYYKLCNYYKWDYSNLV